MIALDHIIAIAVRDPTVLDRLGPALRSDLVVANPYQRRIIEFADTFYLDHQKLPGSGDWELWITTLGGPLQQGTRDALGRLLALDVSTFTPDYLATTAIKQLQCAATEVARARLNSVQQLEPEVFSALAHQIEQIQSSGLQGLTRLADLDVWAKPPREDAVIPTGFPKLDREIRGWGKELWMIIADSGVGKSMLLQNFTANAARRGNRCLHITLEVGLRPQIYRYYRQLAQVTRGEFVAHPKAVRKSLDHWFRYAKGEILLLQYPAYSVTPDDLKRIVEQVQRITGDIDVLTLDYLDLLTLPTATAARHAYTDLGRITHEVRSLCPLFDLSCLTASQTVRRPENAARLVQRDMGDSYNKVRGADGILGLVQTEEEEEVMQGRLNVIKARDSGGRGFETQLYVNKDLALIQELNHPNTVELMRRLGHLPTTPQAPATSVANQLRGSAGVVTT